MGGNYDVTKYLCARAYIDVASDRGIAATPSRSDGHLLKDQAVDANRCARRDDDPVGMRNQKAAANVTIQRNFSTGNNAPEGVSNDDWLAYQ